MFTDLSPVAFGFGGALAGSDWHRATGPRPRWPQ